MLNIVFIGCVEFSEKALIEILPLPGVKVTGIVTRSASNFNSDFISLGSLAEKHGIDCFFSDNEGEKNLEPWLRAKMPDIIFCFGWSFLLKKDLMATAKHGAVGFHPAALPKNRGRHPLIWALALGLPDTASTFFYMDEGADSGPIISQKSIEILETDYARDLYDKVCDVALKQIKEFTMAMVAGDFSAKPQNHSLANSWRKRSKDDGKIDWRMPARGIYNLVRALSEPYPGAVVKYNDIFHVVQKCEVVADISAEYSNIEPGKVVDVADAFILVKAGDHLIKILEAQALKPKIGDYL